MPAPPGFKPSALVEADKIPKSDGVDINTQGVTEDETNYIIKTTLRPEHREDPNILRFIQAYMVTRSVADASREAGITTRSGEILKRRADIHECIARLTAKAVLKYGYDADEMVQRAKEIADLDPLEFEKPDGTYKKLADIPGSARRAVKSFKAKNYFETDENGMKVWKGELISVEFYDKSKSIEMLGKEKDIFKDKKVIEHGITQNMAEFLLESKKRAEERALLSAKDVGASRGLLTSTSAASEILDIVEEGKDE